MGNSAELYEILDGLEEAENAESAIPAMFELMEKYSEADFGTPSPLVHIIEKIGNYENQLKRSVKRVPTYLNVWMVNRMLNGSISNDLRYELTELLEAVFLNSNATQGAKESAQMFVDYQKNKL